MPISPPLCTVDNRTTLNVLDLDSYLYDHIYMALWPS
jgi:hypothetical protein